jgi:hypothetical protein
MSFVIGTLRLPAKRLSTRQRSNESVAIGTPAAARRPNRSRCAAASALAQPIDLWYVGNRWSA